MNIFCWEELEEVGLNESDKSLEIYAHIEMLGRKAMREHYDAGLWRIKNKIPDKIESEN